MNIIPIHLNYLTAPLEDIVKGELHRIGSSLASMQDDGKLCGEEGRFLISEFDFKGDFNSVVEQVEAYLEDLRTNGVTDSQRNTMKNRFELGCELYHEEQEEMESRSEFKEAMEVGDSQLMTTIATRNYALREDMHKRKECICYCNS